MRSLEHAYPLISQNSRVRQSISSPSSPVQGSTAWWRVQAYRFVAGDQISMCLSLARSWKVLKKSKSWFGKGCVSFTPRTHVSYDLWNVINIRSSENDAFSIKQGKVNWAQMPGQNNTAWTVQPHLRYPALFTFYFFFRSCLLHSFT